MERTIIPDTRRIQKIIRILFCHRCFARTFIRIPYDSDENNYYKKDKKEEENSNYSPAAQLFFFLHDFRCYHLSLLETNNSFVYFNSRKKPDRFAKPVRFKLQYKSISFQNFFFQRNFFLIFK